MKFCDLTVTDKVTYFNQILVHLFLLFVVNLINKILFKPKWHIDAAKILIEFDIFFIFFSIKCPFDILSYLLLCPFDILSF